MVQKFNSVQIMRRDQKQNRYEQFLEWPLGEKERPGLFFGWLLKA